MTSKSPNLLFLDEPDLVALCIRGYTVGEQFADGGYSTIYCGTRHDRPCAIKHLLISQKNGGAILREIFMLRKLGKHPNIIFMYDLYLIKRHKGVKEVLLFMELMLGGNLGAFIKKTKKQGAIPERPVALSLFKQICEAIAFMHEQGFAHRDLKPANILLDESKSIAKVGDFGLACIGYEPSTGQTQNCTDFHGTLAFMAPELLLLNSFTGSSIGAASYDPFPADVWSLGNLLYLLLHNGDGPFPLEQLSDALTKKRYNENFLQLINRTVIRFGEHLSTEARDLCKKMLEKNPKDRPTMGDILRHDWFRNTTD